MIKKLIMWALPGLIIIGLILTGTEVIFKLIYMVAFSGSNFIVLASPFLSKAKYFVLFLVFLIFFRRHAMITEAGEKLIPLLMLFSVFGVLFTSFWLTGVSEDKIVQYRPWGIKKYIWEDVEEVTTEIVVKRRSRSKTIGTSVVVYRYILNMGNGKGVNVWGDISSNYELDVIVKDMGLKVVEKTDNSYNRIYNMVRYTSDENLDKLENVFGVSDLYKEEGE